MRDLSRPVIIAIAGATAVVVNLIVFGLGSVAGGDFRFTANGEPARVEALTVAVLALARRAAAPVLA